MDDLDREFMGFYTNIAKSYGMNDLQAKIISILYLEPEEVAMEEIAKRTGYSLASISNTIKILENTGTIQRIRKPKTKKVFFYMEKDLAKLNKQKIKRFHENLIKPAKKQLPEIINKYRYKVKDEKSRKKLHVIENYYRQLLQAEKILEHVLEKLDEISIQNIK